MTSPDPRRLERLLDHHHLTVLQLAELIDLEPYDLRMGLYARNLPIGALARLADLLGEPVPYCSPAPAVAADRAVVGAHMATMPNGATRDDLAHALGWTLDRLERALVDLEGQVREAGIRIVTVQGRLKLAGRLHHITPVSRRRLAQQTVTEVPVELAAEIYRTWRWIPVYEQDRSARETALRHGLLTTVGRDILGVSEPVAFSLCLDIEDDPPHPGSTQAR